MVPVSLRARMWTRPVPEIEAGTLAAGVQAWDSETAIPSRIDPTNLRAEEFFMKVSLVLRAKVEIGWGEFRSR